MTNHNSSSILGPQFGVRAENLTSAPSVKYPKNRTLATIRAFLRQNEAGGSLVELAVSLPILLLIMTGIFSFSIALNQKLV